MVAIKTTITFIFDGLDAKELEAYKEKADECEKKAKESGIFWGRRDSDKGVSIMAQRYADIKRTNETNEIPTVPVSKRGNKKNRKR